MPDISDFVQWAIGSGVLVWAFRQGMEAFAALIKARAAKEAAEAAQDVAGAKALEDALERVDKLEARVEDLEQALATERKQRSDERRHFEGQIHVLKEQLAAERRARAEAVEREDDLRKEMTSLRNDVTSGYTRPTPMLPPKPEPR